MTNDDYVAYVSATGARAPRHWVSGSPPAGKGAHPVLWVSLTDAEAYCAWRTSQYPGWAIRVPTEAEWENAAAGPGKTTWPWGSAQSTAYSGGVLSTPFNYNGVCAASCRRPTAPASGQGCFWPRTRRGLASGHECDADGGEAAGWAGSDCGGGPIVAGRGGVVGMTALEVLAEMGRRAEVVAAEIYFEGECLRELRPLQLLRYSAVRTPRLDPRRFVREGARIEGKDLKGLSLREVQSMLGDRTEARLRRQFKRLGVETKTRVHVHFRSLCVELLVAISRRVRGAEVAVET